MQCNPKENPDELGFDPFFEELTPLKSKTGSGFEIEAVRIEGV